MIAYEENNFLQLANKNVCGCDRGFFEEILFNIVGF